MDPHDLTAAYALDALGPDEAEAYERHLSRCDECREQLAELSETSAALAFATAAPAPPPRLRAAILDAAAAERANVVPLVRRNRWVSRGLAVAAAAAACVAVGLGVSLSQSSHTRVFSVVVDAQGNGTLSVSGLAKAPHGKTYEAWVIPAGQAPRPAALFAGSTTAPIPFQVTVPKHAVVAVTIERAGGVSAPTSTPIFSTRT